MARTDLLALAIGVGFVVGGGAFWSMALRSQREAAAAEPGVVRAAPPEAVASAAPSAAPCPTLPPAAGLTPAPAVSVQMVGGSVGFRFVRGDVLLLKEDR